MARRKLLFLACYRRLFLILLLPTASCSFIEDASDLSNTFFIQFNIKSEAASINIHHLDIFVFDDDEKGLLDSYSHIDGYPEGFIETASRSGNKRIVCVANADSSLFTVGSTLSYVNFGKIRNSFCTEISESPVVVGEIRTGAGTSVRSNSIEMMPLISKIRLKSLRFDFSATPYASEEVTEVRTYMINIPSSCFLLSGNDSIVDGILNYSRLMEEDVDKMKEPDLVYHTDPYGADFGCYPCARRENELGSCAPRLVIEGKIRGTIWYWPINIGEECVERGCCYNVYATITRLGTADPDIPAETGNMSIEFEVKKWNVYENENIPY